MKISWDRAEPHPREIIELPDHVMPGNYGHVHDLDNARPEKRVSAAGNIDEKMSCAASTGGSGAPVSSNATIDPIDIREGDWKAYQQFSKRQHDKDALIASYGNLAAYKRACALAYLGRRAQIHGGVCSTLHPHILTQKFIMNLEANNRAVRFSRYPWLEALLTILADIERMQDELTNTGNVISLIGANRF